MKDKFKNILRTVAPTLATAWGGPFAGMAVKAATGLLMGKENATTDPKVLEDYVLSHDGDMAMLAALKKADQEFLKSMKELGVRSEELAYEDTASARDMRIATKSKFPEYLTAGILLGFFILAGLITFGLAPSDPNFSLIVGAVIAEAARASGFWLGSSSGSKAKTEALATELRSDNGLRGTGGG